MQEKTHLQWSSWNEPHLSQILKFKCHNDDSTGTPEHHINIPHLLPVYLLPHPHKNSWNREMRRDGGQKEGIRKKMLDYPENMHVLTNIGHIQQACSYIHNTIMTGSMYALSSNYKTYLTNVTTGTYLSYVYKYLWNCHSRFYMPSWWAL